MKKNICCSLFIESDRQHKKQKKSEGVDQLQTADRVKLDFLDRKSVIKIIRSMIKVFAKKATFTGFDC